MAKYTTTVGGSLNELVAYIKHNESRMGSTITLEEEITGKILLYSEEGTLYIFFVLTIIRYKNIQFCGFLAMISPNFQPFDRLLYLSLLIWIVHPIMIKSKDIVTMIFHLVQ